MPTPTLTIDQLLYLNNQGFNPSLQKIINEQLIAFASSSNHKFLMAKITTPAGGTPSFVDSGINTLGNNSPLVWSRISLGTYKLTSPGAFTGNILPRYCLSMGKSINTGFPPSNPLVIHPETRYKVTKLNNNEILVENTNNSEPTDFSELVPIVFELIMY